MSTIEAALAELARVPPRDFTRTRTALAARLREAGDAKVAARVKARRAPTIPVWVVNRLAQDAGEDVGALISASKDLRAAQLGRRAQSQSVGEATAQRRAALDRLLKRARTLLRDAGTAPGHQMLLRIQTLLTAAAADAALQRALRTGEIEQELAAAGFDVFGGVKPPVGRTAKETRVPKREERGSQATSHKPSGKARAADTRRREREERQRQREEQRQDREARRLASARAALQAAESEAAAAKQRLAEATRELDTLHEQVDQARRLRTHRQAEARKAERAVTTARRALEGAGRRAAAR